MEVSECMRKEGMEKEGKRARQERKRNGRNGALKTKRKE